MRPSDMYNLVGLLPIGTVENKSQYNEEVFRGIIAICINGAFSTVHAQNSSSENSPKNGVVPNKRSERAYMQTGSVVVRGKKIRGLGNINGQINTKPIGTIICIGLD